MEEVECPTCTLLLQVAPSGLFGIVCMAVMVSPISGGHENEHSLTKLHQLGASPNVVPSVVHKVCLPVGTPVVGTSSVPSIGRSHDNNVGVSRRSQGW
ncbi:hypothetical protein CTI12_AA155440 [Artemisia annua]|uniref:Uncharacterized protein n=1 Tax=Artemisia annua TaxID=35608 RepID=A0A2U1PGE1_ARTAN|nr:hypothetical protein CTI12_AA155440 [Artemisia annua]